jgi:uncharacterized protein (DUF1800 family)
MNEPVCPEVHRSPKWSRRGVIALGAALPLAQIGLSGCVSAPAGSAAAKKGDRDALYRGVDRMTWGATRETMARASRAGYERYVDEQLAADPSRSITPAAQAQIDALTITTTPMIELLKRTDDMRKAAQDKPAEDERKAAQQAFQQEMTRLAKEAAARHLLRAVYSEQQLLEHMTWFWMNHFNVHQYKGTLRVMLGDYEATVRAHALGRFRDLVSATAHHPAMLRYLDNEQNAVNRINENYARELMELHTLGVDGGYQQRDVQELARVLTGFGVSINDARPRMRPEREALYVRQGAFEFNPMRHDFGDKLFLGQTIRGKGTAEFEQVLDLISTHPSTARFVSRKMATYLLADEPPQALVERMAQRFQSSGGRIDATLKLLLTAPEFRAAGPTAASRKFKDPMHYVVSAVRAAYEDKVVLNTNPMQNWLNRMGEGLYNRQTPDGYPMNAAAWTSSGQLATRFEIARALGSGNAGLFKSDDPQRPADVPAFPQLANALYYETVRVTLGPDTRNALAQAASPQEWNALFLSSPEFMYR